MSILPTNQLVVQPISTDVGRGKYNISYIWYYIDGVVIFTLRYSDMILIPCTTLIKNRYASLPKINVYKRKRLPQRKVEESDDIFYYTPAAYENSTGPVFLNHHSKYNTKRLKTPRGKKVCKEYNG